MGVTPAAPAGTAQRPAPHVLTLVALSGVSALSMNVFLPSLPGMARDFDVDYSVMQLSVSAYIGVSAVIQLLAGPISDRLGRRPVILAGFAVFLLATVGTIMATSAAAFLTFRMIQAAVTVGMLVPRAIIRDLYDGDRAAGMIGYVTMGMAVVPMIAPVIGGVVDETLGWRANFFGMGVLGLIVAAWAWRDLGETVRDGGLPLRAQVANYPALARSVRFWGYCAASTLASGAFFAYLGGAPFVGDRVFGLTPAQVGYFFAAPSIGYVLGNFASARLSARVGIDRMILAGSALCAVGLGAALAIDLAGHIGPFSFFGAVAVMGLANGMVLPNATAGMMSVRPELAGTASGLGGALTVAGGAALSALAGAALSRGGGATPLLAIMAASATGSLVAVLWVMARARQTGAATRY